MYLPADLMYTSSTAGLASKQTQITVHRKVLIEPFHVFSIMYIQEQRGSTIITRNISMFKVLHSNPSHNHPDPRHNSRENNQRRVVPHYRKRRIILQLWRRVRCFADIPRPAPDLEAAADPDNKDQPGDHQDNPAPPLGLGVVPCYLGLAFHFDGVCDEG